MKGPTHNRFHFLAIGFLRDVMNVETDALPTNKVASADDPDHARVDGHLLAGYHSQLGYLALMLLLAAGTAGMASIRPGLGATPTLALQLVTVVTTITSAVLLVVDTVRRRRRARPIDMVLQAGPATADAVDAAQLERWHADARGQLWVIAERSFTRDALALAQTNGIRCFTRTKGAFEEVRETADVVAIADREAA